MTSEIPESVRIRTGEGNEWRYEQIEKAAEFYDCNRSNAVSFACSDVIELIDGITRVLERTDLTRSQREEITNQLSTRNIKFRLSELDVSIEK